MLPIILNDQAVHPFRFYLEGCLHEGISYQNSLYKLVKTFSKEEILNVRSYCRHLSRDRESVIVTVSQRQYKVWIDLRTQITPSTSSVQYA